METVELITETMMDDQGDFGSDGGDLHEGSERLKGWLK